MNIRLQRLYSLLNINTFCLLLFIGLCIRLSLAILLEGYCQVRMYVDLLIPIQKEGFLNLYLNSQLNHPPALFWLVWIIGIIADYTHIPFSFLIKILPILADLGMSILIYKASLKLYKEDKISFLLALFYFMSPLPIDSSAYAANFDSILLVFVFLAWYIWEWGANNKKLYFSAICLGVSLLLKLYPIILLPIFLWKIKTFKERVVYSVLVILPVSLTFIPYLLVSPGAVIKDILGYPSGFGIWGYSAILISIRENIGLTGLSPAINFVSDWGKFILLAFLFYQWIFRVKYLSVLSGIILIFTTFYFFTSALFWQYLLWCLPFIIIKRQPNFIFYTIFVTLYLLMIHALSPKLAAVGLYLNQAQVDFAIRLLSLPLWIISGVWMFKKMQNADINKKNYVLTD
ncbi:MAG: hypothetical protein V1701_09750 [Planctomycetota bacterium]